MAWRVEMHDVYMNATLCGCCCCKQQTVVHAVWQLIVCAGAWRSDYETLGYVYKRVCCQLPGNAAVSLQAKESGSDARICV
jgi:hypothetical protein